MARRAIRKYVSGKRLLKDLTDNPALPAFIESLDTPVLKQLIERVGLEDAGALVALTTPKQLVAVLDESIWTSAVPGTPERFDPTEFLRWLEVMLELGDAFACERIEALDEDLLATAFSHYFKVVDLSVKIFEADDDRRVYEAASSGDVVGMYGTYEVTARFEDEWVTLSPMLDALFLENPKLLDAILTRCCLPGAFTENRTAGLAELDAQDRHARSRERRGFVDPLMAGAFLTSAAAAKLDDLAADAEYDLETVRYFAIVERARERPAAKNPTPAAETPNDDFAADLADLEATVSGVIDDHAARPTALLTGPEEPVDTQPLREALSALGLENPAAQQDRMAEVVYLSNMLMVGWTLNGERLTERESVAVVMAAASLGLDYLGADDPLPALLAAPGLVRLFRIGWHIYQGVPKEVALRLQRLMSAVDLTNSPRAWMYAEVVGEVTGSSFLAAVENRQFEAVHETSHMLSLLFSDSQCAALRALINDLPRVLESKSQDGEAAAANDYSYPSSLDYIDQADALFAQLSEQLAKLSQGGSKS